METGACGFARCVKAFHRGAPAKIGANSAHKVVRGGADGNEIAAKIEAVIGEESADAGKARGDVDVAHVAHVEVDGAGRRLRVSGISRAFAGDGAGDNIARSELQQGMIALHESLAAIIAQPGSLAAQRFRDEETRRAFESERGRMELVKLHVGEFGAGNVQPERCRRRWRLRDS